MAHSFRFGLNSQVITLSQGLQAVFDAIERTKLEEFDGNKKSEWMVYLQTCITVATTIEKNFGLPDLAKENETLNAELQLLKTNQASEMDVLRTKLDALLKEQADAKKKDAEIPEDQMEILRSLEPEEIRASELSSIRKYVELPDDEIINHLNLLVKFGRAGQTFDGAIGKKVWFRTDEGNRLVIGWRKEHKRPKSKKLPEAQEEILRMLYSGIDDGMDEIGLLNYLEILGRISIRRLQEHLRILEEKHFVRSEGPSEESVVFDGGGGRKMWFIDNAGRYYVEDYGLK
jgi:hypothetical protein